MIDVIIPAYNAHKSIIKALHSIALQTINDKLNVYIIDDCSTENYDKITMLFSKWLNIKCLTLKKNSGPGVARQFGIDNSNGEYIMFVDSDDILFDCFSIENLYKKIIEDNYDMSVGTFFDEQDDCCFMCSNHQGCLHGKLYKREFIEKNNLFFNDTRSSEDNAFNKLFLLANPKIVYVSDYIYLYRNNKNSITNSDSDYLWYSTEHYVYNMVWVVKEAEIRGFDEKLIAKHIFESCMYIYYIYLIYFNRIDCNLIFEWSRELYQLYLKYNNLLSEQEKYDIYSDFFYFIDYEENKPYFRLLKIPKVSLNEFFAQIQLHN